MDSSYDLVTFGEMLLRLAPPDFQRIEQANYFTIGVTGAEMNACVAAARFGLKTAHVTRLPRNPLGRMIENRIREHGIDTSHIVWLVDLENVDYLGYELISENAELLPARG